MNDNLDVQGGTMSNNSHNPIFGVFIPQGWKIKAFGDLFEFSGGFEDLHTLSYEAILASEGFPLEAARPAIEAVHAIRHQHPLGLQGDYHPLAKLPLVKHPFAR
jgi:hypothetical protein